MTPIIEKGVIFKELLVNKLNGGLYEVLLLKWKDDNSNAINLVDMVSRLQLLIQKQQELSILTTIHDHDIVFVIEIEEKQLSPQLIEHLTHLLTAGQLL
jgi:hypothetical protein